MLPPTLQPHDPAVLCRYLIDARMAASDGISACAISWACCLPFGLTAPMSLRSPPRRDRSSPFRSSSTASMRWSERRAGFLRGAAGQPTQAPGRSRNAHWPLVDEDTASVKCSDCSKLDGSRTCVIVRDPTCRVLSTALGLSVAAQTSIDPAAPQAFIPIVPTCHRVGHGHTHRPDGHRPRPYR